MLCFPKTYELISSHLVEDTAVVVKGRVSRRESSTSIIAMDLAVLDIAESDLDANPPMVIALQAEKVTPTLPPASNGR